MRKTFKYIYTDATGKQTILTKSITDRMEPRDFHKKIYAAMCFTEMLRTQYHGFVYPVLARNIQEV